MSAEYSVKEVRAEAHRHGDHVADMLTAYADHLDRIKADEVKALGTCPTHGVEYVGECSGCAMTLPEKDFTHPPAQAAQGELPTEMSPNAAASYRLGWRDALAAQPRAVPAERVVEGWAAFICLVSWLRANANAAVGDERKAFIEAHNAAKVIERVHIAAAPQPGESA